MPGRSGRLVAGLGFVKGDRSAGIGTFRLVAAAAVAAESSTGVLNEPETGLWVSSVDSLEDVEWLLFLRRKLDFKEPNMLFRFVSTC